MYIEFWKSKAIQYQFNGSSYSLQHFRSKRQGEDSYADLVGEGIVGQDWHGHLSGQNRRLQVVISTSKLIKTRVFANQNMTPHTFSETILVLNDHLYPCISNYHSCLKKNNRQEVSRDCNAATQSEANLAWLSSGAASGLRPLLVNRPELWKFPWSNQERCTKRWHSHQMKWIFWAKSRLLLRQAEYKNINILYNGWHPSLPFIPIGSIQSVLECSETGPWEPAAQKVICPRKRSAQPFCGPGAAVNVSQFPDLNL